jgi:hypothetical protein
MSQNEGMQAGEMSTTHARCNADTRIAYEPRPDGRSSGAVAAYEESLSPSRWRLARRIIAAESRSTTIIGVAQTVVAFNGPGAGQPGVPMPRAPLPSG